MIDADEIFERIEKTVANENYGNDWRSRLAFHCGMLKWEIRELCMYLNNHEEEIQQLKAELLEIRNQL